MEGLKKQYAQLQAKKQSILQTIEAEDAEYEEMLKMNAELAGQKEALLQKLAQMKREIEVLQAEIDRETSSTTMVVPVISHFIHLFSL